MPPATPSVETLRALLEWQIAMGADAAIGDVAVDRLAPPPAPAPAAPPPRSAAPATPAPATIVAPPSALTQSLADAAQSARRLAAGAATIDALGALVAGFDLCPLK